MKRLGLLISLGLVLAGCGGSSEASEPWPHHEISRPDGKPLGTVLYFHGGNWKVGPELVSQTKPAMRKFTRAGWRAFSADYSASDPLGSVLRWYDRLDRKRGRLCVAGDSAGAQLALMVAVRRDPACVIAEGAPVDLTGKTPLHPAVEKGAVRAFGEDRLRAVSPLYSARKIDAPVVLGHYRDDEVVPLAHSRAMKRRGARLRVIDGPGSKPFVHAFHGVKEGDLRRYKRLVRKQLRSVASSR